VRAVAAVIALGAWAGCDDTAPALADLASPRDLARPPDLAPRAVDGGVLATLKANPGQHLSTIFGRDSALGNDAENVLGGLVGTQIGETYDVGGLGLVGTGAPCGGCGEGTIGLGNLGTISGPERGRARYPRRVRSPDVILRTPVVRGAIDKELIRRILRRHINEMRFCYEKELTNFPSLRAHLLLAFTVGADGQVTAADSRGAAGAPRVASCVVAAVRRWEFPRPKDGNAADVGVPIDFDPVASTE
jgi:TonB family protein